MREPFVSRIFNSTAQTINRIRPWHKWPGGIGLAILYGIRDRLRRLNLRDTETLPSQDHAPAGDCKPEYLVSRTLDGTYNDLSNPTMGAVRTRFGRNVPTDKTFPNEATLMTPNPRTISRELLTRDHFQPAQTLNLLAAAWIQFQVHDWFSHGTNEAKCPMEIPLANDDPWPDKPMRVKRTRVDETRPANADGPPTYLNRVTHWWDASQIYGSSEKTAHRLRSHVGGKLKIDADGLLPLDANGLDDTGVNGNYWLGLSLLHTVFVREHNAICDRLQSAYTSWSDDDLFARARLINAALLAKIHTVEWTPAILGHPTIRTAMRGGWWGIAGERITEAIGRLSRNGDILSGIPGSATDHHAAPYSLTEEFVSVYRMHSLMRDTFTFRSATTDEPILQELSLHEISGKRTRSVIAAANSLTDLFYSFGTQHPGALVLHNFPRMLQNLRTEDNEILDLAAVDILRDRERGVPRYNAFREMIHMPRVRSFENLTDNPKTAEELRRVYNNDIDSVDLMVGILAESPRPAGFGFSETAFRIFLLMAPRRLKSDRFLTVDYTPQVYTQTGLDWINDNDMSTVLIRHFPGLQPALARVRNAFVPWRRMHQPMESPKETETWTTRSYSNR
jgi:hypothetical protein